MPSTVVVPISASNGTTNGVTKDVSKPAFPANAASKEYAASLDAEDPLKHFRSKFIIPSKANIACKKLAKPGKPPQLSYAYVSSSLTKYTRPLARSMHLLLWKLARVTTQSDCEIHGSTVGHMGVHRCSGPFHRPRGLAPHTVAAAL